MCVVETEKCGVELSMSDAELCRGTSLARKRNPLGPYRRPMPRVLGGSLGGGRFLMGEVPLLKHIVATG